MKELELMNKIISFLILLAVLGFLGWKILAGWENISTLKWNFGFNDILLILFFLPLPFFFNVFAWHLVTLSQGEKISFSKNFEAWMFSNFARYLPGGIWQYPSRVFLLSKAGVSKESAVKCLILESLFVVFTGLLIVFLVFPTGQLNVSLKTVEYMLLSILSITLFFLLIKSQKFMNFVSWIFAKANRPAAFSHTQISLKWVPVLVLAYFLAFLFPSVILFLLTKEVATLSISSIYVFIGAYAASWLLGYVAFFAPAGIGVREAALAGFLSLYMPFSVSAVVVIGLRVALFVSEALGFALAILLSKKRD